jgi:hypothetical protein
LLDQSYSPSSAQCTKVCLEVLSGGAQSEVFLGFALTT